MNFNKLVMFIRLGREYGRDKIRGAGLSDTEHGIATFLYYHDQVSQDTISVALMLNKTTVAKALNTMEQKGLISRRQNELNRRENVIEITAAGRRGIAHNIDIYDQWFGKVCSCLQEKELEQFESYFDRLLDNALRLRKEALDDKNKKTKE
ncbi:MAG: MarR family transcriptional regulator [Peptococcaceae bacterium]|nr:MarR family transcriptional regulator [Peptococcaceae bacterium]